MKVFISGPVSGMTDNNDSDVDGCIDWQHRIRKALGVSR